MVIVYCKSTWLKKIFFAQVEKRMQILAMFRNCQIEYFCIYINFNLQKSTIMRKFRSQTDRLNVTARKTATFILEKYLKRD